jgi:hypothetical protein
MSAEPKKEIDLVPDAWERFERAVDVVAKSSPQHRSKPKDAKMAAQPKKPPKKKLRSR